MFSGSLMKKSCTSNYTGLGAHGQLLFNRNVVTFKFLVLFDFFAVLFH
jgi:hypothetical protein